MTSGERLLIDGRTLTLEDLVLVARDGAQVGVAPEAMAAVELSRKALERALMSGQPLYGVNTGFGRLSEVVIPPADIRRLQHNLIRSHAAGVGPLLDDDAVRATMLLRANALARGHSGVRPAVLELICDCLNRSVVPVVPSQGSLGASGDLAPLAHIALVLTGQGRARCGGEVLPGGEALRRAGLEPLVLEAKEGLALINGTQVMTAIGGLGAADAWRVLDAADVTAALTFEALGGLTQAFDERIHEARGQPGQVEEARRMAFLLQGSAFTGQAGGGRVQDAYSLRCLPQVHGAVRDALDYGNAVLQRELNATTDNPLVFGGEVLSGGNFHGQPVAIALDTMAIALCALSNISERRIERLLNPDLSGLPAFLTSLGGLHSGLMLAQYTAAALASENKLLASPASVDSIPTSAGQEDHVSMGTIAARKFARVVRHVGQVIGIELLAAVQALDLRAEKEGLRSPLERTGPRTAYAYRLVREKIPGLEADRELAPDLEAAEALVRSGGLDWERVSAVV